MFGDGVFVSKLGTVPLGARPVTSAVTSAIGSVGFAALFVVSVIPSIFFTQAMF